MSSASSFKSKSGKSKLKKAKMASSSHNAKYAKSSKYAKYAKNVYPGNIVNQGLLGVEHKFFDTTLCQGSGVAVPFTGNFTGIFRNPSDGTFAAPNYNGGNTDSVLISTPGQGSGASQRDGKIIRITSVQIKGAVTRAQRGPGVAPNYTPGPTRVHIALVRDSQTNGTVFLPSACFENPGQVPVTAFNSLKSLSAGKRFRVLKAWDIDLPCDALHTYNTDYVDPARQVPFECYLDNLDLQVEWAPGNVAAAITGVTDNSLHIVCWTDTPLNNTASVAATANSAYQPFLTAASHFINYNARIRFVG